MKGLVTRAVALAFGLTLLGALVALGAPVLHGKTYSGSTANKGRSSTGASVIVGKFPVTLRVSANGGSVTGSVGRKGQDALGFCAGFDYVLRSQSAHRASIAKSGAFHLIIDQKLRPVGNFPKRNDMMTVSGKFADRSVTGIVTTNVDSKYCSGWVKFSARAG